MFARDVIEWEVELLPEQYLDVCRLADLRAEHVRDQAAARLERFLELVAAHFPAMAPAIRCVGRHILATVDEFAPGTRSACEVTERAPIAA
jgi:hypothetical protein